MNPRRGPLCPDRKSASGPWTSENSEFEDERLKMFPLRGGRDFDPLRIFLVPKLPVFMIITDRLAADSSENEAIRFG